MKKINNFLFLIDDNEEMSLHDTIWFYGGYSLILLIVSFTFVATL